MKFTLQLLLLSVITIGFASTAYAEYTETMDPNGRTKMPVPTMGLSMTTQKATKARRFKKQSMMLPLLAVGGW